MAKETVELNWLWHKRMSHLNFKKINKLTRQNLVDGLPNVYKKKSVCEVYHKGKQVNSTYKNKKQPSSTRVLDLLHMNLLRLVEPTSLDRKKYIILWLMIFRDSYG